MTTIEKMARAMYEAEPGVHPTEGPQWEWDWMVTEGWALPIIFRKRARAALQAIRDLSDAVSTAADDGVSEYPVHIDEAWTKAIDAILSEQPEP